MTFDESSFPAHKVAELQPTPPIPTPVLVLPNPDAGPLLPETQAPSPVPLVTHSAEEIESLLDPPPVTPPSTILPLQPFNTPHTPQSVRPAPTSPRPRQSAVRIKDEPVSPIAVMPGGFKDRVQRSQLLCEMDNAPRRSTRIPVPDPWYFNLDNAAQKGRRLGYAELLATAYVGRDPASYAEAMRSADADQWSVACQYEIDALSTSGTWELVDLLPNRKAVKSKWVFKLKMKDRKSVV